MDTEELLSTFHIRILMSKFGGPNPTSTDHTHPFGKNILFHGFVDICKYTPLYKFR
jgi:hypothetical protein